MTSTTEYPAAIGCYASSAKYNISNCFFKNISSSHNSPRAGAINIYMINSLGIGYNISGNTFIEVKTNKSVIHLNGGFPSLTFSHNSFYNVSSSNGGGGVY
jgi:hypothetical protein